jgi:hypothetical protein
MYWRINATSVFALLAASVAYPAELKTETLAAWNQYLRKEGVEVQKRANDSQAFLWLDGNPERVNQVRAGLIVVEPMDEQTPLRIPSGLIHHWIGAAFIPNARVEDVLGVTRDYAHYKDYYKPSVEAAKTISSCHNRDEFTITFANNSLLSRTFLQGEYTSDFVRVDAKRWYSVSVTKQMQEIKDLGRLGEKRLPPDKGSGYIWRLYSTVRLEERDGGVFVELEAVALSRDIPGSLHWLVDPIVHRISRDSLEKSLRETAHAVEANEQTIAQASR